MDRNALLVIPLIPYLNISIVAKIIEFMKEPERLCGLIKLDLLGRGSFAGVYSVLSEGKKYALKISNNFDYEEEGINNLIEISILTTIKHPYIISIEELIDSKDCNGISMLLPLKKMNLYGFITEKTSINSKIDIMYKICRAAEFLIEDNILHIDLKPPNILIDEKGDPLITDFGNAVRLDAFNSQIIIPWNAIVERIRPIENLLGSKIYGAQTMIYQLGLIFLFLMTGQESTTESFIMINLSSTDIIRKRVDFFLNLKSEISLEGNLKSEISSEDKPLILDLIIHMLDPDPKKRYNITQVLEHKLFTYGEYTSGEVIHPAIKMDKDVTSLSIERIFIQFANVQYDINITSAVLFLAIDLLYRIPHLGKVDVYNHSITCCFMAWKMYYILIVDRITLTGDIKTILKDNPFTIYADTSKILDMEKKIVMYTKGQLYRSFLYDACTNTKDVMHVVNNILCYPDRYYNVSEDYLDTLRAAKSDRKPSIKYVLEKRITRM